MSNNTSFESFIKKNYKSLYNYLKKQHQGAQIPVSTDNLEISIKVEQDKSRLITNLGTLIKQRRKSKEMAMSDLYKISGVSSSTINDIEKYRYLPSIEGILKLGYALGLEQDEIIDAVFNGDPKYYSADILQEFKDFVEY